MSNGARHAIGVVVGLILTPLVAVCLTYGMARTFLYYREYFHQGGDRWVGAALLLAAAVLLGLSVGSRLSPLASLVPGAAFTAIGALWVAAPRWMSENTARELPDKLDIGYQIVGPYGVFLVLGVALVVASVLPSRWQARAVATPGSAGRHAGRPPGPMRPPPQAGTPAGLGAPPVPGQDPSLPGAPGQDPSWQRPPQYGRGGMQQQGGGPLGAAPLPYESAPQPPSSPPSPPSGSRPPSGAVQFDDDPRPRKPASHSDDDSVGEWTRMYGGDDLRGGGGRQS